MSNANRLSEQAEYYRFVEQVRGYYKSRPGGELKAPLAHVRTYGCQQNVSDSEHIKGMLAEMGFGFTDNPENADFILFNTCAVREHAQDRVFGNVGALKNIKNRRKGTLIALCGCMVQQEHVAEKIKKSYPFVGLVFGTHVIHRLPELLYGALTQKDRIFEIPDQDGCIVEDIPVHRDGKFKAWISIMYGCDNYCTYCIVPHVRGRERSRHPMRILDEARDLVSKGYKEITLLGQNVNSYGRREQHGVDFPKLLEQINAIPGDFLIRFMTSHPKDATQQLFDTIARCEKVERHFHLPFQSGSNRILKAMNRCYTREHYLELIDYAKKAIPGISFTSDVIVGFPGETRDDFEQTLDLIRRVKFNSLFTFMYSPRKGTPAAELPDTIPIEQKNEWFKEMMQVQQRIAADRSAQMVGIKRCALIESADKDYLEARLSDNNVVRVSGDASLVGRWATVEITSAKDWILAGRVTDVQ